MTMSSTTLSSAELRRQLDLYEVKPGVRFSVSALRDLLPDVETVLFFGKVYELNARQLGELLLKVLDTDLATALFGEGAYHSNELQDYLLDDVLPDMYGVNLGDLTFGEFPPKGEILPHVWESLQVEVANSIKAVAAKLESVVGLLPGKQGDMVFSSLMQMNAKRPTIGDFKARVHHPPTKENLLILDVSGSMSEPTIRQIIDDVVALSYTANTHMAVVSNTTTYWLPGSYGVDDVLRACEFGGTHYETLAPLFERDWGVVITVADYDSSPSAKQALATCSGRIDEVLDISLVNRPTYLAECVGQLAAKVSPLLTGNSDYVLV